MPTIFMGQVKPLGSITTAESKAKIWPVKCNCGTSWSYLFLCVFLFIIFIDCTTSCVLYEGTDGHQEIYIF